MDKSISTVLDFVSKMPDILRSVKSDSLIEYTKPTRVEPIVLMDDRVVHWGHTNELMQSLTTLFSGYYLQAVALSVNVNKVDVLKLLDKVNPNRSLDDNIIRGLTDPGGLRSAFEDANSYEFSLPIPGQAIGLEAFGLEAAPVFNARKEAREEERNRREQEKLELDEKKLELEKKRLAHEKEKTKHQKDRDAAASSKDEERFQLEKDKFKHQKDRDSGTGVTGFGKSIELAREATNLSVGKLLEVEIEDGGKKAVFPVMVRLIVTTTPPEGIVHVLSYGAKDRSVKERWHMWRSGQINFIRDLVLCQDLIQEHKDGLMKDKSGIFSSSMQRRRENKISAILTKNPSVATASNIVVLSDQTRKELERNIGGRLKDFRTREKIFKQTYGMILAVVDPEWDSVTIYHRSIDMPTELTARDLKVANSKGVDVGEILKAYQLGSSPSF